MKKIISSIPYLVAFSVFVFADQLSKIAAIAHLKNQPDIVLIKNILRFQYLENKGAAWGIFQGHTWLFSLITIFIMSMIVFFFIKMPYQKKFIPLRIVLTILAAGAIGNFIDRITAGYVVDFIYFEIINFPIFNVADIYVCISVIILMYLLIFHYKEEELTWNKN